MKRIIKFRAWDIALKQMFEPDWLTADGTVYDSESYDQPCCHPECELMQFTGLFDKNGKEVFEGDILLCEPPFGATWEVFKAPVVWDEYRAQYIVKYKPREPNHFPLNFFVGPIADRQAEVVGNVWENPELVTA